MRTTAHILALHVFMACLTVLHCSWLLLDYTIKPHWNSLGFLIFSTSLLPSYHNNHTSYRFGEFIIFRDNNLRSKLACLHPCSDTDFYNWKQKIHWSPCRVVVVAALEVNILVLKEETRSKNPKGLSWKESRWVKYLIATTTTGAEVL